MKFSILVPMYNVENFLSESIDSVLQQSYQDFELILVNDGSKDSTLNIASRYKKNDHRIVIINQENKGLLQARRVAIDKSVGEYLIILDSDDLLELNMLETLKKHIDKTESDLILFKHKNIDENGSIWKKEKHPLENLYYNKDKILDLFLVEFKLHNIWGKCFKSNLLKDDFIDFNKLGHINMNEDRLQSLYGLYHAKKITFVDEYLYNYRANPASLTRRFNKKGILDSIKVYETIFEHYNKKIEKKILEKMIVSDALQTIGKYLRWISTNNISKQENNEMLDYIINNNVIRRAKPYISGLKNRFIYNSIIKKNKMNIKLLKFLNKSRIKKQNKE